MMQKVRHDRRLLTLSIVLYVMILIKEDSFLFDVRYVWHLKGKMMS